MRRRTKIVCTIGPSTSSPAGLAGLLRAGMDVARLNFSHGTHDEHAEVITRLRRLAEHRDRPLAIMQDLSGPKVRLGAIASGQVSLKRGQTITLTTRDVPGDAHAVNLPIPELVAALKPGDRVLVDDGCLELVVTQASGPDVTVRAASAGVLSSHKGVSAPGVRLHIRAFTPKDVDDLRFGLEQGVDWVAVSFVRGPEDLAERRAFMEQVGIRRPLIAKIEMREAVHRIEEIVVASDGVMVARGDLGVEVPIDQVPMLQKRIIRLCNRAGKPVITATQMLESMVQSPRPTRAEVTDVANAIIDGSDAVMLSAETAAGAYPLEAARMMARVAAQADACVTEAPPLGPREGHPPDVADVVAQAAVEMARDLRASAILCATTSGSTARRIARCRPRTPVAAATPNPETCRQLALSWGVEPLLVAAAPDTDGMMEEAVAAVVGRGLVKAGDRVIITAGAPANMVGTTNLIRVHTVGEPLAPSR